MLQVQGLELNKLNRDFYERETIDVAKDLLGKYFVHEIQGNMLIGKIIETEAYKENDKASHFYLRKRTKRTEVVFQQGGLAYVYLIYGMYNCFNIVTEKQGEPGAVLIRQLEPIYGIDIMKQNRNIYEKKKLKILCNGPGKLCMALSITREHNGIDLTEDTLYIAEDIKSSYEHSIKCAKRINIDYAQECKDLLWRFYI